MGHPNTKKHKANHCGYKKRPSLREVNALLEMYAGVSKLPEVILPRKEQAGAQLTLF
jgi:hypothetical protein